MKQLGATTRVAAESAAHEASPIPGKATQVDDTASDASAFDGAEWEAIDPTEHAEHDLAALASDVATHAATEHDPPAPKRTQARAKPKPPSRARAGRPVNIALGNMLQGTTLTPALVRLVRAMRRDGIRVADRPKGIAALMTAVEANVQALAPLTGTPDVKAFVNAHVTGVIPTRDGKVLRSTTDVARAVVRFLKGHAGSRVLIDEAGQGRFELVRDVARMLAQKQPSATLLADLDVSADEYQALRGRWGAYVSAKPGGIQKSRRLRGTLQALRGAGASAVVEAYGVGVNPYDERDERLAEAKRSIALLRPYIAQASLALGVDPKRLGVDEEKHTVDGQRVASKQRRRAIFLARLRRVMKDAHRMAPHIPLGSWVSRMEGDAAQDDAELRALLG